MSALSVRLLDLLLGHRAVVLVAVAVITIGMGLMAGHLEFSTSPETILQTQDDDLLRLREHEEVFGTFERRLLLVIRTSDAFEPEILARIRNASDRVAALAVTEDVRSLTHSGFPLPAPESTGFRDAVLANRLLTPFLVSRDGRTTAIHAELTRAADDARRRAESIEAVTTAVRDAGLLPIVAGVPAVRRAYAQHIRRDLLLLPPTVGLVLLGLLFLAVRRVVPVVGLSLSVVLAAAWTVGIMALTGGRITALTSILPALIMVVGVATGIHVVAQFREETGRGADSRSAARTSVARMALPCGLTALTTAVGFSSLAVAGIRDVREFGVYSATGALMAFLIGVPLVGILLSFSPPRIAVTRALPFGGALDGLARLLVRRPWIGIAAGAIPAVLSTFGIARLHTETFLLEDLRPGEPIHEAVGLVDRDLGGVIGFDLVIRSEAGLLRPEAVRWMARVERELRSIPGIHSVVGPVTLIGEAARVVGREEDVGTLAPVLVRGLEARGGERVVRAFLSSDGRMARIGIHPGDVGSVRAAAIRDRALTIAGRGAPSGATVRVAGLALFAETVLDRLVREMGKSLAIAFVVIFFLMSLLFRSLRVGALSMVPNFLPLLVAAGYMGLMGITVRSSIALIFAVALGLAVDDTIHVLTRYLRERRAGTANVDAVAAAVRWTGRPVILTSVVLFVGFLTFLISGFKATAEFGAISAVTIATAIVGDLFLLPGMLLLWPPRVRAGE